MSRKFSVVWVFIGLLLLVSCATNKKLSNRNLASLYTPDLNFTYPKFRPYHLTADSVQLFYRIRTSDFLAQRADSAGSFFIRVGIETLLFTTYASRVALDTVSVELTAEAQPTGEIRIPGQDSANTEVQPVMEFLEGSVMLKAPAGQDYILQVFVTDVNRRTSVSTFLNLDRTGIQPAGDFLPKDPATGKVIISPYTDHLDTFYLESALHPGKSGWLRYFNRQYPIAAPPFSVRDAQPLSYASDYAYPVRSLDSLQFETFTPGIIHIQFDTLVKEGFSFFRFQGDYPILTEANSLIESIRYLTTRKEHDQLLHSENKKEAIDDFWISLAGNHERARVLIRSYYSRVQLANQWFTSYLDGWKSDRGLIFIIFGPPAAVYRDDTSESWNYSSASSFGSLIFTFDHLPNPFTDNDYQLRRNPNYEGAWYRAVDGWREGKVIDGNN